jgi:hypothetical protein
MSDTIDTIINDILRTNSTATSSRTTVSIRQFVTDFSANRYKFNLPFQRKPQWKQSEKSEWIRALLMGTLMDPLSISLRGRHKRGINGGNRARATVDYTLNRFPMDVVVGRDTYHYWFSEIPAQHRTGRTAKSHRTLPVDVREGKFLDRDLDLNIRQNLTDDEEVEWYENMNRNMKSHTKGQLLISKLCKEIDNPFVVSTLELFPILKTRIQMPLSTEVDDNALGAQLAELFSSDPNPMDERDIREDHALIFATYVNLLANGRPYNDGFVGECDTSVIRRNANTILEIFDGLPISEGMYGEFHTPSSSKKQFIPKIWAPSYLLGPMCWSIGKQKENVVQVWRSFLSRCLPNTIASTYLDDNDEAHLDDTSVRKYETAWNNVLARHV